MNSAGKLREDCNTEGESAFIVDSLLDISAIAGLQEVGGKKIFIIQIINIMKRTNY